MIDTNALKGIIYARGLNQGMLAARMGISSTALSKKMKRGVFNSNEISAMIEILNIEDPLTIFFVNRVS